MTINPGDEFVKRDKELQQKLFDFVLEFYRLSVQKEDIGKRLHELDLQVSDVLGRIQANNQAARDFDTYLAVREGAVTLDDIKKGVELAGKDKPAQNSKKEK